jgi:hypothetical protein
MHRRVGYLPWFVMEGTEKSKATMYRRTPWFTRHRLGRLAEALPEARELE